MTPHPPFIIVHEFAIRLGVLPPLTGFGIAMLFAFLIGQLVATEELQRRGQGAAALAMADVTVGAVVGAVLLLILPAGAFGAIVPALIGLALLLVVFGPQVTACGGETRSPPSDSQPPQNSGICWTLFPWIRRPIITELSRYLSSFTCCL